MSTSLGLMLVPGPGLAASRRRRRTKVYVSSAARDLGAARAAVIDAIHRAGCDQVSMES